MDGDSMEMQAALVGQLLDATYDGSSAAKLEDIAKDRGDDEAIVTRIEKQQRGLPGRQGVVASSSASQPPEMAFPENDVADQTCTDSADDDSPQARESVIKFLVPNNLAGSLIGKAGATIKDIQQQASCMVRIATSGMYFPGTAERAVIVVGDIDAVKSACALILHTIHWPNKGAVSGAPCLMEQADAKRVEVTQRLLIPLSAGGLVIGRKGANIAALLKASGAKVSLGQKSEVKANERIVTVTGTLSSATKATEMLVDKLREEPATSRFANMSVNYRGQGSYSQAAAGAGVATSSRPFSTEKTTSASGADNAVDADSDPPVPAPSSSINGANGTHAAAAESSPSRGPKGSGGGRGASRRPQQQQQQNHPPYLPNSGARRPPQGRPPGPGVRAGQQRQTPAMPPSGHPPQVLGMAAGGPVAHLPDNPGQVPIHRMGMQYPHHPPGAVFRPVMSGAGVLQVPPSGACAAAAAGGAVGVGQGVGPGGVPRGYPSPQMFAYEPMTNPVAMAIAACQPTTTVSVGVPDNMVGAILGRGGSTINELQSVSGARITVSQRDDLMPGTENRILTISGTAMATQTAQYLVSQKIEAIATSAAEWPGRRGGEAS